jgi:hypothetical protein
MHAEISNNTSNDKTYNEIDKTIKSKHPNKEELVKCISQKYRDDKVVDRFYTGDGKSPEKLDAYFKGAEVYCNFHINFKNNLFLILSSVAIIVTICLSCCCCKCLC